MTLVRSTFYVLYIALGTIILYRMVAAGIRWETLSGVLLGSLLIALGVYRLHLITRLRRPL